MAKLSSMIRLAHASAPRNNRAQGNALCSFFDPYVGQDAGYLQVTRLSEFGVSHLSDNVVLLQYIRDGSTVRRALTVLKTRASRHEPEIREFRIAPEGIVLGGPIDGIERPSRDPAPVHGRSGAGTSHRGLRC